MKSLLLHCRAWQLKQRRSIFAKRDWEVIAVLNTTGPWALRAAFQRFSRDFGYLKMSYIGAWTINTTKVMVYPLGTWSVSSPAYKLYPLEPIQRSI